jgi:hypothetical protein
VKDRQPGSMEVPTLYREMWVPAASSTLSSYMGGGGVIEHQQRRITGETGHQDRRIRRK